MQSYDRIQWTEQAVRGIVSPKERQSARQELLDHIDDHCEALMATGLPRSRALEQAVTAMGDPNEVAKHLRRVHQPILTHLLRVMRTVLLLLVCLFCLRCLICLINSDTPLPLWLCGDPQKANEHALCFRIPPEQEQQDFLLARKKVHPDTRLHIGDYTVTVHSAVVSQYEGAYEVHILLDFTARSLLQDEPVFTQHLLLQSGEEITENFPYYQANFRNLRHHYVLIHDDFICDPQTVTLTYPAEEGGFSMEIDLKGGWVYEKSR